MLVELGIHGASVFDQNSKMFDQIDKTKYTIRNMWCTSRILYPLLFLWNVNDINKSFRQIYSLLFADHTFFSDINNHPNI